MSFASFGWIEVVGQNGTWNPEALRAATERNTRSPASVERSSQTSDPDDLGLGNDVRSMRALSVRQPFAEAINRGTKISEFRSGPTTIRGRILIYASQARYGPEEETQLAHEYGIKDFEPDDLFRGVIVGSVDTSSLRRERTICHKTAPRQSKRKTACKTIPIVQFGRDRMDMRCPDNSALEHRSRSLICQSGLAGRAVGHPAQGVHLQQVTHEL